MASKKDALDKVKGGESISKKRSLKQQIRDTQRLLTKEDLPETVRLTKERVLKSLHGELNDKASQRQKQKISKKYRMVKFFDKRKVVRRLSRACKEFSEGGLTEDERSELSVMIQRLIQELNYTVHFPPDEKYISLYPSSTPSSESALTKREELLTCIAESVASGELPDAASLEREVVLPGELAGSVTKSHETSRQPVQHRERAPKRKKRISNESEVDSVIVETSKKKLREDGFFLVDSRT
ncbi:uncharacterized protein LOC135349849 isoform X2 [Halichondria panicea]|uniref:uncharacterized protein LOC135349849 isoform X2 n=1 Tax=Halichondria panicea TaxID=6063 RepID=UPI00312B6D91